MWVHCPMSEEVAGKKQPPEEVSLTWAGRSYPLRKGINEIPEGVAQAYFLYGLPEQLEADEENWKKALKKALERWGMALKSPPPNPEFLAQFKLSETREGLEEILKSTETKSN